MSEGDVILKNEFEHPEYLLEEDEKNDDADTDADEMDEKENLLDQAFEGVGLVLRMETVSSLDGDEASRRSTSTKYDFDLGDDENGSKTSGSDS